MDRNHFSFKRHQYDIVEDLPDKLKSEYFLAIIECSLGIKNVEDIYFKNKELRGIWVLRAKREVASSLMSFDKSKSESNKYPSDRAKKKYLKWRKEVFKRDCYKCSECGDIESELHAHHIVHFSKNEELRFDVNNGITLCSGCHILFHLKNEK